MTRAAPERVSEALLRHAPDLLLELSPRGIEYVSPNVKTILGIEPAALVGQPVDALVHPDDRKALSNALRSVAAAPGRAAIHQRLLHADGRAPWFESTITPFTTSDGALRSAMVARLIDEPVSSARHPDRWSALDRAQSIANTGHWELSLETGKFRGSRQILEILGLPPDASPSRASLLAMIPEDERDQVRAAIRAASEGRTEPPIRHRVVRPDGSVRWVDHTLDVRPGVWSGTLAIMGVMQDVTGHIAAIDAARAANEALGESEALLLEALRVARASTWKWDRRTRQIWNSPALAEMLGYGSAVEGPPQPTVFRRHPDEASAVQQRIENAIRHRQPYTVRTRVERADGTWLWAEERGIPVFDAHGELTGYRGTTQDVHEQVAREEALRERDTLVQEALHVARATIWTWDRRTREAWQSPDLFEVLGLGTLPGRFEERLALVHADDRDTYQQQASDAIRSREPFTVRYRLPRPDGGWIWIEERGVPVFDVAGELTGYRGTAQDVDDQVRREQALSESDTRQRHALHIARATIWTWDHATKVLWQSPELYELLGYESIPGTFEERVALRHPDDQAHSRRVAEEAIRARRAFVVRYRLAAPGGGWNWLEQRGAPQYNARGEYIGFRGTLQDIDAQVRREEALRESDERQREALRIARAEIWIYDPQTGAMTQSDSLLKSLGHDGLHASMDDQTALWHPDDRDLAREVTTSAMSARRPFMVRYRLARADGSWAWVEDRGEPRYDSAGAYIGYRGTRQDVDDQVRREEALRESDQRQREALRIAHAATWTWDRRTRVLWRSPEFYQLVGYERSDGLDDSRENFRHPDDRDQAQEEADSKIKARKPYRVRLRLRHRDGSWRWMEQRGEPVFDEAGEYTGYRGTMQDIDDQVRREEALRESDNRQREALSIARAAVWRWDPVTGQVDQSPELHERLGYDSTPLTYEGHMALRHPDDRERSRQESAEAVAAKRPYTVRYRLARKDGGYVWIEARGVPQLDANGELVAYQGTSQDVDDQIMREEALRESDDRQREALRIARASVWTYDAATRETTQSPDLYELLGYEAMPETRDARFARRHPDDLDRSLNDAYAAMRRRESYATRYRMQRADGSWAWIESRGVPQFDARGKYIGYRGTAQDVDDQVRREEELRASDDRQREALRIARASLWIWDRRTRYLTQSHDLYQMLGYGGSPEPFDDRVAMRHPDDREASRQAAEDAIRQRQPYVIRYRLARASGGWAWIEERGTPLFDADGELTGYRGTTQDVDDQVRREEELREALKIARAGFWHRGRDGVSWWSPELYEMVGLDFTADVSYDNWVRHPDDEARVAAAIRAAMQAREPYTLRYRVLHHRTGEWLWVEMRGVPVYAADGSALAYRGVVRDITEEMARDADLRRSEAFLDEAQRLTMVGSWSVDLETGVERWSDGLYRLLGYQPGKVTPSREAILARVHPEDLPSVTARSEQVRTAGTRAAGTFRIVRPNGAVRYVTGSAERRHDAEGRPAEVLGVLQDVTDQIETESRLRRSEERLRAVVDSVGDGITLMSRDGKGDWANDAFYKMVGYTPEELAATGPAIVFDRTTIRDAVAWLRAVREPGSPSLPHSYPMRLHRKDGTIVTAESTPSVLRDGNEVIGLLSVIRDTTERDHLQAQVAAATLEIQQILQTAALPIIVIEEDGTVSLANRRTIDTFGWSPEELAGQDVSILAAGMSPTTHADYIRHYHDTGTASEPHGPMLGRTLEVTARHRDGTEFPVEVSVTEMHDPDGRRRYLGVVTDLTDRKRAEEELTRMQKAEALGTLVAGVAHDFNNLLTAMVGGIELAKAQPGDARWLDLAHEAADRATRLVQQLLQFSRRSRTEQQDVEPASLVERTAALVRETFDRRIEVGLELSTIWGVIPGDEGQLQQVVMNLLVNARDAVLERSEHEGPAFKPEIRVSLSEDQLRGGPAVRISVRDNGPGMPPAVRARAFDPFFTTKGVGQGTGLGLATVAGIIERHDGEVSIDSALGAGTTVFVRLPLRETNGQAATSGETPLRLVATGTRTAMVIDDEDMVRSIATGYLEAAHYRVIPMSNGNAAIRLLEAGTEIDVVLTDINMPSPNGWEILARLQGKPGIPPIVVASGYADEAAALERGAAAFLHKPFSQASLLETINRVLRAE